MARAGRIEIEFAANLARLQQDVGKATSMLDGFASTAKATLGAIGAGLSVAAFVSFVKETADGIDKLGKLGQQTGMTAQQISKLSYIAKMADLDVEQLAKGVKILDKNMFQAAQGGGKAYEAFRTLGISAKDATGHLVGNEAMLGALAEKFSKMPDGAMKTALAMQIFGRSGADMIPMLNLGREGLKYFADEAERLKGVLSDEIVQKAEAIHQAFKKFEVVREVAGKQLFSGMADDILRLTAAWDLLITRTNTWNTVGKVVGFVLKAIAGSFTALAFAAEYSIQVVVNMIDLFKTKWDQMADIVNQSGIKKAFEEAFGFKLDLPQFNEARVSLDVMNGRLGAIKDKWREVARSIDIFGQREVKMPPIPKVPQGAEPAVPISKKDADQWAKIQAEMTADLQRHSQGLDEHDKAITKVNERYDEFKVKSAEHARAIDENRFKVIGLIRSEQDLANALKATALAVQAERDEFERRQQTLNLNRYRLTGAEQAATEAANLQHLVDGFRDLLAQQDLTTDKGRAIADQLIQQIDANERLIDSIKKRNEVETEGLEGVIAAISTYRTEVENLGKQMGDMFVRDVKLMEDALVDFCMTGKLNFSDLIKSIEADLIRLAVRQAITGPLSSALSNTLGGVKGGGSMPWDTLFDIGPSFAYHKGGVVGQGGSPRSMPSSMFARAPRLHGGLAADEVPAILQKGETVIPKGQGQKAVNVTMNVYTQDASSFKASEGQILRRIGSGMRRAAR